MVDLHLHILPGLDDGAQTLEEALHMAAIAADSGVFHMAATSHGNYYDYTMQEYQQAFQRLQDALTEKDIPVKLHPGMEIFTDENAGMLLDKGELLTLNGTRYILIEFDFEENVENVWKYVADLKQRRYNIVLAHPERYLFIQKDPEFAYFLVQQGCILQVNKGSIFGQFGRRCQELAEQFLEDDMVAVVATDAHDTRYRSPSIARLERYLQSRYGQARTRLWLSENPSRILKGYPVLGADGHTG